MRSTPSNARFKALADETRREILKLLRSGPRTSGGLADRFHSSWPTPSGALALLREGGRVVTERKGQEIYYELKADMVIPLLIAFALPATAAVVYITLLPLCC